MDKDDVAFRPPPRAWVRAEDYTEALIRRRTARRASVLKPRTQPETPRILLSTVPFLALLGALAVLCAAIIIAAWPHAQAAAERPSTRSEPGTASKGWFQEAEKQFR